LSLVQLIEQTIQLIELTVSWLSQRFQ